MDVQDGRVMQPAMTSRSNSTLRDGEVMEAVPNQRPKTFDSYVPRVASEWDGEEPGSLWRPVAGTLLFVDITGFTNLSERLARRGRIGAEELTSVLNRVFGRMLDVVYGRGGSLVKFGGDALLLLFQHTDHVMQAAAAAVEMRAVLREASKVPTSVGRISLKMSSGIHTGSLDFFLVGDSHRELLVTGPTASLTTEMESNADANEIVVSESVREALPEGFTGDRKGSGWLLRKQRINHPPSGLVLRDPRSEEEISRFVPRGLRRHLAAGIAEPEHRISTIAFVKFEGVDRLLAEFGPERVGEALDELVTLVQMAADREGLTFLASDIHADGGKLILVAGVPASQPDDEGRVLRAARDILDGRNELGLRIGVNRGHVFSGEVGNAYRRTYTVIGDTVNLAARLMTAAEPGSLYVSPTVLDRSSTVFRTKVLEPFNVKGKERPIQVYAVYEETGARPPELERGRLPFHGRESELEMIVGKINTCTRVGSEGMITITGDTGLGKTRLITEVLERCPGMATLVVQAEPTVANNPYWAFRDPLRMVLGIERAGQAEMASKLEKVINEVDPGLAWAIPLLGDVMHIEVPETEETAAIDPKFRPERTADALIKLLSARYTGPFAAVGEDGHWMDDASIALLRRIGEAARQHRWVVIFLARKERSEFEPLGDEVPLRPLDDESVRTIVIEATSAAPLRPHELDAVVARAGGNPLFLSEMITMIRETGSAEELPESLDAVVSSEIDTLPPLTRQLLRYASVLGRSFRRVVLNELLAPEQVEIDDATQRDLGRFIDVDGTSRLRFRHAMVRDVAYQGLSYRRRRELHARAGDVIARLAGDDPDSVSESLAFHYAQSGDHAKVWHFARIAADKASRAYANTDAAAHYQSAIEAFRHLEDLDPSEVADIWTRLGEVKDLSGQYEDARDAYRRALLISPGDPVRSAELYLRRAEAWMGSGDLAQAKRSITIGRKRMAGVETAEFRRLLARLDAYEASIHAANGDPLKASKSAAQAVERARSSGEEEALARAYGVLDWANFMMGHDEPRHGEEAIGIYQRLGFLERSVGLINNMGVYAYLEGRWDAAIEWYEASLDAAERSGNVIEAALTRANMSEVLIGQRKYADALPLIETARRVYEASHATHYKPLIDLLQARAQLGMGLIDEAVRSLRDSLTLQRRAGAVAWTAEAEVTLAEALVEAGQPEEALARLTAFEEEAPDQARDVASGIFRVRGLARDRLGHDRRAVEEALENGLDSALEGGDLFNEALVREARVTKRQRAGEDPDPADVDRLNDLFRLLGIVAPQPAQSVSI